MSGVRFSARRNGQGECRMLQPRLRSLEERHQALERRISEEDLRPQPDVAELHRLKREKLKLKEEIERLRRTMH